MVEVRILSFTITAALTGPLMVIVIVRALVRVIETLARVAITVTTVVVVVVTKACSSCSMYFVLF